MINYITKFAFQTHCWKYDKTKKKAGFVEWKFAIRYQPLPDRFIATLFYHFIFRCAVSHSPGVSYLSSTTSVRPFTQNRSLALGPNRARLSLARVCMLEGSNYNWLREFDNGRALSSNFIRELSPSRIIYNGLISYNQV